MVQADFGEWLPAKTGRSVEGREITFYLSAAHQPSTTLDILIFSAIHGDEPESAQVVRQFMQDYSPDRFSGYNIGVIPVLNPDGLARNQRTNIQGVDLNRNFPTRDWAELHQGDIYYSGPQAASEPETRFLLEIINQHRPRRIVSVHTPYRVINFDGPGRALADAMALANGYPVVADIGYATPGSFGTYVGKERGIPTVTLELPEKEAFTPDELVHNVDALRIAVSFEPPQLKAC